MDNIDIKIPIVDINKMINYDPLNNTYDSDMIFNLVKDNFTYGDRKLTLKHKTIKKYSYCEWFHSPNHRERRKGITFNDKLSKTAQQLINEYYNDKELEIITTKLNELANQIQLF